MTNEDKSGLKMLIGIFGSLFGVISIGNLILLFDGQVSRANVATLAETVNPLLEGCAIKVNINPNPTGDTYSEAFAFHVTETNESKYLNVSYLEFHLTIEWKGNVYTGEMNLLQPSAGDTVGKTFFVDVDEDHPADRFSKPVIKSIKIHPSYSDLALRDSKTGQELRVSADQCKVNFFLNGKEWHQ